MSKSLTTQIFIERAKKIHGDKYNYSKVNYINITTKVCIICSKHGEFWQRPNDHLLGKGCSKCAFNRTLTTNEFIDKANKIHNNFYIYDKTAYKKAKEKVTITCPIHGDFLQTPQHHLMGCGCPKCRYIKSANSKRLSTKEFIEKAKQIHGDKYDYSKVNYTDCETKVCIICPEHGEFWQKPSEHLCGHGCKYCNTSILENEIEKELKKLNINYEREYSKYLNKLRLDFYLPDYKIGIECQGIQHFEPTDFGGKGEKWAEKQLIESKKRDNKKLELCKKQGIKLIYYLNNSKYFGNYTNEIHSPIEIKKFI